MIEVSNKKILGFADVHLGIKTHSTQQSSGLFDAEIEARIALNEILKRFSEDDIEIAICAGDMFHTSHPTTQNNEFITSWIEQMDLVGKPFLIIPGNHCVSTHSHSLEFISEMKKLENIFIYDALSYRNMPKFKFYDWNIVVVPYIQNYNNRDKDKLTFSAIKESINNIHDKTIFVSHIQESSCTVGSESTMISKYVETIDFNSISQKNIIALTGHIHKHQIYEKRNGTVVVYPGSLFYLDKTDANQKKGYVLINKDGKINFEEIKGIRRFVYYQIPPLVQPIEYLKKIRFLRNQVVFLSVSLDEKIDSNIIREFLKIKGCLLGSIENVFSKERKFNIAEISLEKKNKFSVFKDTVQMLLKENKIDYVEDVLSEGILLLEEVLKDVDTK
jgi:DNA repair exonuclease SbcCD nuclease subunit